MNDLAMLMANMMSIVITVARFANATAVGLALLMGVPLVKLDATGW